MGGGLTAILSLVASGVVWGFTWLPLKYFASLGLDGHAIAVTAYVVVSLFALPVIWRERAQWRNEFRLLLLIGLFFGLANFALNLALMTGSVVRVMLLFFLLPAWGVIGGRIFLKEALGWRRLLAVALCLAGVFILVGGVELWREPLTLADGAALLAGVVYTLGGISNRAAREIPMASRTLVSFVGCAAIGVGGLFVHLPSLPSLAMADWILLLLFASVWIMGATLLTTYGVTHLPASRAGVVQVIELVVAIVSAVMIGGEVLSLAEYVGSGLIVAATLVEATGQ